MLADYFKDVDWAPSDVAVGLVLLKREQKIVREATEVIRCFSDGTLTDFSLKASSKSIPVSFNVKTSVSPSIHQLTTKKTSRNPLPEIAEASPPPFVEQVACTSPTETLDQKDIAQTQMPIVSQEPVFELQDKASTPRLMHKQRAKMSKNDPLSSNSFYIRRNSVDVIRKLGRRLTFDNLSSLKRLGEKGIVDSDLCNLAKSKRRKSFFRIGANASRSKFEEALPNGTPYNTFPDMTSNSNPITRKASLCTSDIIQEYPFKSAADTDTERNFMTKEDIRDVLHFIHYAEMAYITLDLETHSKIDLLTHFSPRNDLFRSPYMVCIDHDWKCVVVAIRGTFSPQDVVTDLKVQGQGLDGPDDIKQVHSGMLLNAKNIFQDLIEENVLKNLITNSSAETSGYSIVVTGHSMGGSVGTLVAYFLRQYGYKSVRCYAFSPAPIANYHGASIFDHFCISVVTGDDIIPRMNVHSLNILKSDIQRLIGNCDMAKHQILGSVISNYMRGKTEKSKALIDRLKNGIKSTATTHPLKHIPQSELKRIREETRSISKKWRGEDPDIEIQIDHQFFIAGKILYIEKIRDFAAKYHVQQIQSEFKKDVVDRNNSVQKLKQQLSSKLKNIKERVRNYKYLYVPRWADRKEFQNIVISKSMLEDHLPFGISKELEAFPRGMPLVTTT